MKHLRKDSGAYVEPQDGREVGDGGEDSLLDNLIRGGEGLNDKESVKRVTDGKTRCDNASAEFGHAINLLCQR